MPRKTKTTAKKHTTIPPTAKAPAAKATAAVESPKSAPAAVSPVAANVAPKVVKDPTPVAAASEVHATKPIGKPHDAAALQPVLAALRDLDADIAREAASSLGLLGDAAAVEPLIEVVANANGYFHSVVRSAAAVSLGQLKDPRAIDALLNAVHDPIADSSSEAIHALGALGDRRAVSTLVEVTRNRSGYFVNSVRRAAVLSLIKLGGEEAQSELRLVSEDLGEDPVIRNEATAAVTVNQG